MLLYARTALPKQAKKRSRAGCAYCKEKKKKCDETRPNCGRCVEIGKECVYEAVKPRQRRKQDSTEDEEGPNATPTLADRTVRRDNSTTDHDRQYDTWQGSMNNQDVGFNAIRDDLLPVHQEDLPFTQLGAGGNIHQNSGQLVHVSPSPHFELRIPSFSDISSRPRERLLLDHFHNVLSHLIVLQEDDGNPFQRLVLPLSNHSPAVRNAIFSLSSAHREFQAGRPEEGSLVFHNATIRNLAKLIEQGSGVNKNELMATVILLIYYEVLMQQGRSSFVAHHLKGAVAIMNRGPELVDPTSVFLERAFRFYDVIAALSLGTPTLSPLSANSTTGLFAPVDARGATRPVGSADVLLGMATSLWPTIQQLSNLSGLKTELQFATAEGDTAREEALRSELDRSAATVEEALIAWQPENMNVSAHYGGILNSAMAYRYSGLVYLYRSVRGVPTSHETVQLHTHVALCHCVGTVKSKGPMGALLWPLFVAACEAQTASDRALAQEAFESLNRRQRMTNIERAWDIVQEVWRRADKSDAGAGENDGGTPDGNDERARDLWREVSQEMGLRVVFG